MNAAIESTLRRILRDQGIDYLTEPELPATDLAADALAPIGESWAALARALGWDGSADLCPPLFALPRSNLAIEQQLLNLHLALIRAMILLGYDWPRLEEAMQAVLAQNDTAPDFLMQPTAHIQ